MFAVFKTSSLPLAPAAEADLPTEAVEGPLLRPDTVVAGARAAAQPMEQKDRVLSPIRNATSAKAGPGSWFRAIFPAHQQLPAAPAPNRGNLPKQALGKDPG